MPNGHLRESSGVLVNVIQTLQGPKVVPDDPGRGPGAPGSVSGAPLRRTKRDQGTPVEPKRLPKGSQERPECDPRATPEGRNLRKSGPGAQSTEK